jgi:hypothetical protein
MLNPLTLDFLTLLAQVNDVSMGKCCECWT